MAKELVKTAIEQLEKAINEGEHNCDVFVERLGEMKEVCFIWTAKTMNRSLFL